MRKNPDAEYRPCCCRCRLLGETRDTSHGDRPGRRSVVSARAGARAASKASLCLAGAWARIRDMFPGRRKSPVVVAAEKAAQSTLDNLWGDEGFPVDPFRLAKQLGLEVWSAALNEGVAGQLAKVPGRAPVVILNRVDPRNRQRFTCAHELGHYYQRVKQQEACDYVDTSTYAYVDFRDGRSSSGTDAEEQFANAFAAALLMPAEAIKKAAQKGWNLLVLADFFGVSAEAMRFRLCNLGLETAD